MALERFERRIGVSDAAGGGVSQIVDARGVDIAPAIDQLQGQLRKTFEPKAIAKAEEQAIKDAGEIEWSKDENGNYAIPETPNGGVAYAAAFDNAKLNQYLIETQHASEIRFNEIFYSKETIGMKPAVRLGQAEAYMAGVLEGVDPRVAGKMKEFLSREIRQRDLRARGEAFDQGQKNMVSTFNAKAARGVTNARAAAFAGNFAEIERVALETLDQFDIMISAGLATEEDKNDYKVTINGFVGMGRMLGQFRIYRDEYTSFDIEQAQQVLDGVQKGDILGMPSSEVFEWLPTQQLRNEYGNLIGSVLQEKRREEDDVLEMSESEEVALVESGDGKPFGVSDEKHALYADQVMRENGIDPLSAEGPQWSYTHVGDLPTLIYKRAFEGASLKTDTELEKLLPVYKTMGHIMTHDGTIASVKDLNVDDEAFMYHYQIQRSQKVSPADAKKFAQAASRANLGITTTASMKLLRTELGAGKTDDDVKDWIDNDLGADWDKLGARAQKTILLRTAALVASGMPLREAGKAASANFKSTHVQDRYDLDSAIMNQGENYLGGLVNIRDSTGALIPASHSPGAIPDGLGKMTREYLESAVDYSLKNLAGPQQAGAPKMKDMKLGVNVYYKYTGVSTNDGGKIFSLWYSDPSGNSYDTFQIRGKDGRPLLVDLGNAYKVQKEYAAKQANTAGTKARVKQGEADYSTPKSAITSIIGETIKVGEAVLGIVDDVKNNVEGNFPNNLTPWKDSHLLVKTSIGTGRPKEPGTSVIGSNADYKKKIAVAESSGGTNLGKLAYKNGAYGKYQFITSTWIPLYKKRYGRKGLTDRQIDAKRANPEMQEELMDDLIAESKAFLKSKGISLTLRNIYAVHHMGQETALRMIRGDPGAPMASIIGAKSDVMNRNPTFRNTTVGAVLNKWARQMN